MTIKNLFPFFSDVTQDFSWNCSYMYKCNTERKKCSLHSNYCDVAFKKFFKFLIEHWKYVIRLKLNIKACIGGIRIYWCFDESTYLYKF